MGRRTVGLALAFAVGVTLLAVPQAVGASVKGDPTATTLWLRVDDKRVGPGERATFSARLQNSTTGSPAAGADVLLMRRPVDGRLWRFVDVKRTGLDGRVAWTKYISASGEYQALFRGSSAYSLARSDNRTVVVKPIVTSRLSRDWVRPTGSVRLDARVRPVFDSERVRLQRKVGGVWRTADRQKQGGQGRVTFRIGGMDAYGPERYRVAVGERIGHLPAISEPWKLTTVRLVTYRIETRGKVAGVLDAFKQRTAEIYADPRGWSRSYVHFKRVTSGGGFSLFLSQAKFVPSFGSVCARYWSCRVGRNVIINENRWRRGTPHFKRSGGTMAEYRAMVTNHETGHWFGLGHATCGGRGEAAPVMMQQSKGLYGCEPNAWPIPGEIAGVR
ncbi:MAG: DUF3152 domain-containing protein [Actinomycetia bacterium]|nr:DUF3152 domain-containing protein [Actinomycetes bacterium]